MLSIVQMPGGVPVATVAIGKAGAVNAGLLAAQILSAFDEKLAGRLDELITAFQHGFSDAFPSFIQSSGKLFVKS